MSHDIANPISEEMMSMDQLMESLSRMEVANTTPAAPNIVSSLSTSPPIGELPTEILLRIFFHLVHNRTGHVKHSTFRDDVKTASQVCWLWREIALGSTLLWAHNLDWNNAPPKWFQFILERSGIADIDTAMHLNFVCSRRTRLEANVKEFPRVRERTKSLILCVHFTSDFQRVFQAPFPLLEELWITVYAQLPAVDAKHVTWPFKDIRSMAPRLRTLELRRFTPNFNFPFYHNLQIFSAMDLPRPPNIAKWLDVLGAMPDLTELTIKGPLGEWPGPRIDGHRNPPPVRLPKLTMLSLAGYIGRDNGIDTLLSYLETPRGCSLYFAGRLQHRVKLDDAGIIAWFKRWDDEDYKSPSIHACLDLNRVILHNQYGEKPWPGLWFRISLECCRAWEDKPSYIIQRRQRIISRMSGKLISILGKSITTTKKLTIWTCGPGSPIAMPYLEFIGLFKSLRSLQISVRQPFRSTKRDDHISVFDALHHLSEIMSPIFRKKSLEQGPAADMLPQLHEIIVAKNGRSIRLEPSNVFELFRVYEQDTDPTFSLIGADNSTMTTVA